MTTPRLRPARSLWPTILTLAGLSLVIIAVMSPWWIFSSTTPTGGDTGAHVLGPAYLRDNLLPEGRILGWSNAWFAGFPAFYFYFPLPSLTIVALDLFLPYGVAFKLVTVLGLLAMPVAAYYLATSMRLGRNVSLVAASAAAVFAFFESYTIYGGNIASSLAGEFSYSWSMALSLVYLGLLIRAVRDDRRYFKWAALALAATALSHILTTLVVIFASLFVLPWRGGLKRGVGVWIWGFAIAAFWALPVLLRIGLTSDMAWRPLDRWEELFPIEIWLLLPIAIAGGVWAMRRGGRAGPLIGATLLPLIYYPLPTVLPEWFPDMFGGDRWKLWNGRLLPYWYLGVAFFAAVGVGAAMIWASRRLPSRSSSHWARALLVLITIVAAGLIAISPEFPDWAWVIAAASGFGLLIWSWYWPETMSTRMFLTIGATAVLSLGALSSVSFVDGWSAWNYEGYETKEPWPEYQALMTEIESLPPGRVQWEGNAQWGDYGTPMAPMLIPYWTEGTHQSMEGLYFESSLTTPFHFINSSEMSFEASNPIPGLRYTNLSMDRGLRHLDLYGVRYYVSITPEATEEASEREDLRLIATTGPFTIFELPPSDLVEPLEYVPSVYDVPDRGLLDSLIGTQSTTGADGRPVLGFHDMALDWYDDIEGLDRLVVADGPDSWPRIQRLEQRPALPTIGDGEVSDIVVEDHEISFTTTAIGIPHLVKVSYFPNWTAEGADGPYRATPSLMVVVPTSADVVIRFENTWVENAGAVLSVAGVVALIVVLVVGRRRRLSETLPEEPS